MTPSRYLPPGTTLCTRSNTERRTSNIIPDVSPLLLPAPETHTCDRTRGQWVWSQCHSMLSKDKKHAVKTGQLETKNQVCLHVHGQANINTSTHANALHHALTGRCRRSNTLVQQQSRSRLKPMCKSLNLYLMPTLQILHSHKLLARKNAFPFTESVISIIYCWKS